jgi:hypothetical protein
MLRIPAIERELVEDLPLECRSSLVPPRIGVGRDLPKACADGNEPGALGNAMVVPLAERVVDRISDSVPRPIQRLSKRCLTSRRA